MGGDPETEQSTCDRESLWRRAVPTAEGNLLLAGVVLLTSYAVVLGLLKFRSPERFHNMLTMTLAHLLGGRAAGMTSGYAANIPHSAVVLANMAIETFLVLIFYGLFVFSYRRLIVIGPLEDTMARIRRGAEARQKTIMKFGIPGLLLFVWFPFWMTGPLVGSVIGFLIGLRTWLNLGVVLAGTWLAILCWGILLRRMHEAMRHLGYYVPFVFVGFVLLVAVSIHIRHAFARQGNHKKH